MRADRRRLSQLGEFGFIDRLRKLRLPRRGVEVGIGDDCAVVLVDRRRLLLTTDALIEEVHFRRAWDTYAGLGRRAFAVNASDIAAMGGMPRFALLSLGVPTDSRVTDLEGFVRGFARAASASGCALVGGNLSASRRWMISVTVIGEAADPPLRRSGARPGDLLYVSGRLGAAAFGREILLGRRRGARRHTRAFLRPEPRLDLGRNLARTRAASAAIDVSDGLLADLGHLCRESRVGAVVEARRLPFARALGDLPARERLALALGGGEDYELLFAVPPRRVLRLAAAPRAAVRATCIGRLTSERGIRVLGDPAAVDASRSAGFDHFRGIGG
jgi:thiamine-monophosphate kinase